MSTNFLSLSNELILEIINYSVGDALTNLASTNSRVYWLAHNFLADNRQKQQQFGIICGDGRCATDTNCSHNGMGLEILMTAIETDPRVVQYIKYITQLETREVQYDFTQQPDHANLAQALKTLEERGRDRHKDIISDDATTLTAVGVMVLVWLLGNAPRLVVMTSNRASTVYVEYLTKLAKGTALPRPSPSRLPLGLDYQPRSLLVCFDALKHPFTHYMHNAPTNSMTFLVKQPSVQAHIPTWHFKSLIGAFDSFDTIEFWTTENVQRRPLWSFLFHYTKFVREWARNMSATRAIIFSARLGIMARERGMAEWINTDQNDGLQVPSVQLHDNEEDNEYCIILPGAVQRSVAAGYGAGSSNY